MLAFFRFGRSGLKLELEEDEGGGCVISMYSGVGLEEVGRMSSGVWSLVVRVVRVVRVVSSLDGWLLPTDEEGEEAWSLKWSVLSSPAIVHV